MTTVNLKYTHKRLHKATGIIHSGAPFYMNIRRLASCCVNLRDKVIMFKLY